MTAVASVFELEPPVEDRLDRIETNIAHMQTNIVQIETNIERMQTNIVQIETNIALMQSDIVHLQSDMTDIKTDMRYVHNRIDKLDDKFTRKFELVDNRFDQLDAKLTGKFDSLKDLIKMDTARAHDRVWFLLMSAAQLGIMARAFKWL